MVSIREIADTHGFSGSRYHRHAEFSAPRSYTVDENTHRGPTVNTSVDCYVTGIYTGMQGRSLSIKQRYTVFVSYNRATLKTAMDRVRGQIISDFENNFPEFRIADVFIPEQQFMAPTGPSDADEMYEGSHLFKQLSRMDVGRYRVATERDIMSSRIKQIKRQYGLR